MLGAKGDILFSQQRQTQNISVRILNTYITTSAGVWAGGQLETHVLLCRYPNVINQVYNQLKRISSAVLVRQKVFHNTVKE